MRFHLPRLTRGRRARVHAAEGDRSYAPPNAHLRRSNRVKTLRAGGEAFPAMLAAIASARSHVHLEMYILRNDRIGRTFQQALIERARAGVHVRVIYDALGSFGLASAYIDEMRAAGIETIEFHPMAPWRPRWDLNKRDHQKILVVDDRVGFTGGLNIGDEYVPIEEGGGGWYDAQVEVEGPAVFDLAALFRRIWLKNGGSYFPEPTVHAVQPLPGEHLTPVQVISNARLRTRFHMRRAYVHAIRRAERRICIMNAYFIPDRVLRRHFARAVQRGVDVRVIVPSTSDVSAVYWATRYLYTRLMRRGVRIYEWPERMMHAKSGIIDAVWSTIGSYNLDRRSLLHNFEVGLIVLDREVGRALEAQFDEDLKGCREVLLAEWDKRSKLSRVLEWFFFQFRYWL
jgi:cardiolipin synthase